MRGDHGSWNEMGWMEWMDGFIGRRHLSLATDVHNITP